jgi:hypothetical protein
MFAVGRLKLKLEAGPEVRFSWEGNSGVGVGLVGKWF